MRSSKNQCNSAGRRYRSISFGTQIEEASALGDPSQAANPRGQLLHFLLLRQEKGRSQRLQDYGHRGCSRSSQFHGVHGAITRHLHG